MKRAILIVLIGGLLILSNIGYIVQTSGTIDVEVGLSYFIWAYAYNSAWILTGIFLISEGVQRMRSSKRE